MTCLILLPSWHDEKNIFITGHQEEVINQMSSPVFLLSGGSIYPVLKFTIEGKLVFWLPVWHFVHPEPVECGLQVSRLQSADVLHICKWQKTLRFSLMLITNTQAKALRPLKSSASGSSTFMTITSSRFLLHRSEPESPTPSPRMTSPGEQTWCTHDRTLKLQELWSKITKERCL